MPEQGGLCASAEDGQNAALDRVQKRVWLAGIGARLPQIRGCSTEGRRTFLAEVQASLGRCGLGGEHLLPMQSRMGPPSATVALLATSRSIAALVVSPPFRMARASLIVAGVRGVARGGR
jgi:hypothetical protein